MNKDDIYFTFDIQYNKEELAEVFYELDKKDKWDGYIPPKYDTTKYSINNFTAVTYRYYQDIDDIDIIKKIREKINFPYLNYEYTQLLKFPPFNGPTIHRDRERQTAVLLPVYTYEVYEPIKFYDNKTKKELFEVDYKDCGIVFDAQHLHAVKNKAYNRYSLQFDLREKFCDVYKRFKEGKFLKC